MALTQAQQNQLAQLQALQAQEAMAATQALIAGLNSAGVGGALIAQCDAVLASVDRDSGLATDVANLRNVLSLSAGNLATRLAPLHARAATAAEPQ